MGQAFAGLGEVCARLDGWALVAALGGLEAAAGAPPEAWWAAGLPRGVDPHGLPDGSPPLTVADPRWPSALNVPYGPFRLYAHGRLDPLDAPAVAIVGSRECTSYGRGWARRLAEGVRAAGGVVVSGLARGIDAEAHEAAGGATIAVLGSGLGHPLPGWQARLARRVVDGGGLLLSEFDPARAPDTWTFPVRNRIVAGLARVVVVVEAGHRSGAKNTVSHALRIGREVLVVPGPLEAEASAGCLDLLEEGASMVRSVDTVLRAAGLSSKTAPPPSSGDPLLEHLVVPRTVDELIARTGCPAREVLERLGALQLQGRLARHPGGRHALR